MTIQYSALGFELTTSWSWVFSNIHSTTAILWANLKSKRLKLNWEEAFYLNGLARNLEINPFSYL